MSPVILFLLLLLLSFGVLLYFLRPSQVETAVKSRLAGIEVGRVVGTSGNATILKQEASAAPWLDEMAMQLPGSSTLSQLIRQSGKKWSVSSLVFGSLAAALAMWWFASLFTDNLAVS